MSLDISNAGLSENKSSQGLVFDSDGVCIIGSYGDELSAYRARRGWSETLHSYFLLESERDYDLEISLSTDSSKFLLICSFTSACGRYAFWRLVNSQAPEAQQQLSDMGIVKKATSKNSKASLWNTSENRNPLPIVITGAGHDCIPARGQLSKSSSKIAKFLRKLID